ncbi:MAG TPA: AIPR family protein, partial [Terracidiphilus sp.]|nr:AIPR family protein [Terracidiphilus sp.]
SPERFLAYNNGISATAEEVELTRGKDGHVSIEVIRDLQIVNGGQTTASIHRAEKEDKVDLSSVFVQAKISIVDPALKDEFVPLISKYANSQNAVREADFSANDSFHIEMERLSECTWCPGEQSRWFYERARGQYQVAKSREATTPARKRQFDERCPSTQKFEKTDLAKYAHSWQQLPHVVSKGAQKNFVEFMLRLKNLGEGWQPDSIYFREVVAQAILFKGAQRIVRKLKIPAYGANVVTYTISYLASRSAGRLDLQQIWEMQELPEGIASAIQSWAPRIYDELVAGSAGRNVTEWAKKEDCWRHIRSLVEEIPPSLDAMLKEFQPMPNVGAHASVGKTKVSRLESENISRVMQVSAEAWFQVSDWGRKTGNLKAWQSGIAHTLSGYASGGWEKVPSAKQANQAVKILELATAENPALLGQ